MQCSIDLYGIHGTYTRRLRRGPPVFMNLHCYAYNADRLPMPSPLAGTLTQAAGPFAGESRLRASRQHNQNTSFHLLEPARLNRGGEP